MADCVSFLVDSHHFCISFPFHRCSIWGHFSSLDTLSYTKIHSATSDAIHEETHAYTVSFEFTQYYVFIAVPRFAIIIVVLRFASVIYFHLVVKAAFCQLKPFPHSRWVKCISVACLDASNGSFDSMWTGRGQRWSATGKNLIYNKNKFRMFEWNLFAYKFSARDAGRNGIHRRRRQTHAHTHIHRVIE